MYVPSHFARTDPAELWGFMKSHSFALLVSDRGGEPFATHLPLLPDPSASALIGHMARANPHWHGLDGRPALAVFSGPHAYVSPAWYEAENVVPTWNYVAVHATGTFRLIDDPDETARILAETVATYEGGRADPWRLDTDTDFFRGMVRGVVGFRIEVTRLEGKWKVSQNQVPERREKVARELEQSANPDDREIARLIRAATR